MALCRGWRASLDRNFVDANCGRNRLSLCADCGVVGRKNDPDTHWLTRWLAGIRYFGVLGAYAMRGSPLLLGRIVSGGCWRGGSAGRPGGRFKMARVIARLAGR